MTADKKIYIFVGPPGSGKGSLSYLCKKNLGWAHLSTGNLCRQHIGRMTDIGQQIQSAINAGKLIDDQLMITMVERWVDEWMQSATALILDGFPRTVAQARALDRLFTQRFNNAESVVVTMKISDNLVISRLKTRYVCQNEECQTVYALTGLQAQTQVVCKECSSTLVQRNDDTSDVVQERLKTYHRYAADLLAYYRGMGRKIIDLNVELPLEHVFNTFVASTGKLR